MTDNPHFRNYIYPFDHQTGRILTVNGKTYGQGFASKEDVLHFYPDAVFIEESYKND